MRWSIASTDEFMGVYGCLSSCASRFLKSFLPRPAYFYTQPLNCPQLRTECGQASAQNLVKILTTSQAYATSARLWSAARAYILS